MLEKKTTEVSTEEVLNDLHIAVASREVSILGRKEVFMGKAKFGIFGDGKEVAQIAMAKVFRNGDFRSGYYRDQTFALAVGEMTLNQWFAQLYAHTDVEADPMSAGRQMNNHFATRMLDENGKLKDLANRKNIVSDISPTAGQMPRLVGLAQASKLFRENETLRKLDHLSHNGREVAFGTIGNASTSEGMFLEAVNAIGVLQAPALIAIWDDEYGISVPNKYQTTKGDITKALAGFQRMNGEEGYEIIRVKGWDYPALIKAFRKAEKYAREEHVPVLVHVLEMTQPQGHSTSGSHERYKSPERLEWEKNHDCIDKMVEWILANELASMEEVDQTIANAKKAAKDARNQAWDAFYSPIKKDYDQLLVTCKKLMKDQQAPGDRIKAIYDEIKDVSHSDKGLIHSSIKRIYRILPGDHPLRPELASWYKRLLENVSDQYQSHLYAEHDRDIITRDIPPAYAEDSRLVDGREVVRACFDAAFERDSRVLAFGEDVGRIGDVNQGFAGLQEKYGKDRISDTGIRETTIIGQGIGLAIRGLKPIAEIQYLDYLVYALATLTDDLACLHYRTKGGQQAPLIVRTRGHRLEGIWHAGSPISMILGSLRGMYVLTPRNMTQAAGMYNTLFESNNPALVIESLNGYRLKERMPVNIGDFRVPLGVPDILRTGNDISIVTYGSTCRIVEKAAAQLEEEWGITCEVIDVQSLLPFDVHHKIVESIKKTNRVLFVDEDLPGGGTGYMMQQVVDVQGAYHYLDSAPAVLSATAHRPAYGSDGDYFSKPNTEDVYDKVYSIMREVNPVKYPELL